MKGCLIGEALSHSYSKTIHELLGTNYDLVNLKKDELASFLKTSSYDFINVTIPYKEEVIKYLDILDDSVKDIKACNLIKCDNGKLIGYNTDYLGFGKMLENNHINVENKKVLVLGSGGASKSVCYYLKNNNALIYIASRTKTGNNFVSYDNLDDDYNIIINTTPVGMYPNIMDKLPIDLTKFKKLDCVIDIIYNPLRTNLLLDANKLNINALNGIEMLIYQATFVYDVDLSVEEKAIIDLFNQNRNIVLIGMPGAGKSTIGKKLALEYPEKDYYDVDEIIEERFGKISDIFALYGESKFRLYEYEVIKELSLKENAIISTGGGFFKTRENIALLKAKGALYFVNTSLDKIKKNIKIDGSRPLIKDLNDIDKLYQERINKYLDIMDYEIKD